MAQPGFQISPPTRNTVNKELVEVCATICHRMYDENLSIERDLPFGAKFRVVDDHFVKDISPRFAIVLYKNCLILSWRGSVSLWDWTANFAGSPVRSGRWNDIAPNLLVHKAYCADVESDLASHEKLMMTLFKENKKINEIIFTGHSLGGGMANIAHIIVKSQLEQKGTSWKKSSPHNLTCRTVAFAAPMTTLNIEPEFDAATPTNTFLRTVSVNTCNFIYSFDPVPHAVGDVDYLKEVVKRLKNKLGGIAKICLVVVKADSKIDYVMENLDKLKEYHHIGEIIYYDVTNSRYPYCILCDSKLVNPTPNFRSGTILPPPQTASTKDKIYEAHMFFPVAFVDPTYRSG